MGPRGFELKVTFSLTLFSTFYLDFSSNWENITWSEVSFVYRLIKGHLWGKEGPSVSWIVAPRTSKWEGETLAVKSILSTLVGSVDKNRLKRSHIWKKQWVNRWRGPGPGVYEKMGRHLSYKNTGVGSSPASLRSSLVTKVGGLESSRKEEDSLRNRQWI